jgi:hypothetical protein
MPALSTPPEASTRVKRSRPLAPPDSAPNRADHPSPRIHHPPGAPTQAPPLSARPTSSPSQSSVCGGGQGGGQRSTHKSQVRRTHFSGPRHRCLGQRPRKTPPTTNGERRSRGGREPARRAPPNKGPPDSLPRANGPPIDSPGHRPGKTPRPPLRGKTQPGRAGPRPTSPNNQRSAGHQIPLPLRSGAGGRGKRLNPTKPCPHDSLPRANGPPIDRPGHRPGNNTPLTTKGERRSRGGREPA